MSLKLNDFLYDLRSNAKKYEQIDINGKADSTFLQKHGKKIICSLVSGTLIFFLDKGFSITFIDYAGTILSILIGLFITALIFSFDKFYSTEKKDVTYKVYSKADKKNEQYIIEQDKKIVLSSKEKLLNTQAYNYTKQFAYLTGYNIVLCIYVLLLLSISSLFEEAMSINIFQTSIMLDYKSIQWDNIILFALSMFVFVQRLFVIYWIMSVMYNTIFIVSSMVNFMMIKMDIKND